MPPEPLRPYDEQVLHELIRWKNPPSTFKGRLADRAERVLERIVALVPTKLVEQVLGVLMPRVARFTTYATSSGMVINAYGRAGHDVGSIDDIARLPLEAADRVAGDKRFQEGLTAAAEGGAAGFVGGPVLIADIAFWRFARLRAAPWCTALIRETARNSRTFLRSSTPPHDLGRKASSSLDAASRRRPRQSGAGNSPRPQSTVCSRDFPNRSLPASLA
jgi:hypothetical protein